MLEGLEMYKDDWNKVCEHVGTRTQDECILRFLQLPIEDPYLEGNGSALGPLAYQPIPFSQSGNPVMSTVAFLASIVDPRVSSAAAKAALDEFSKLRDEVSPSFIESNREAIETALKNGKKLDENSSLELLGLTNNAEPKTDDVDDESKVKQEKMDVNEEHAGGATSQLNHDDEPKKMDVEDNGTQIINEDGPSAVSKSSSALEPEAKKLPATDINERDLKAAAASALAAAAVKAKVRRFSAQTCSLLSLSLVLGLDRRTQDQISGRSSGGNADQETGDQTATLRRTGDHHGSRTGNARDPTTTITTRATTIPIGTNQKLGTETTATNLDGQHCTYAAIDTDHQQWQAAANDEQRHFPTSSSACRASAHGNDGFPFGHDQRERSVDAKRRINGFSAKRW